MARPILRPGSKAGRIGLVDASIVGVGAWVRELNRAQRESVASIRGANIRKVGDLAQAGSKYLNEGRLRPAERGARPRERMTGKFDKFGVRGGGTFVGFLTQNRNAGVYGFGWPNVAVADQKTNYVWRTLEYGLDEKREGPLGLLSQYGASFPDLGPSGKHILPKAFTFRPWEYRTGKMIIFRKGRRGGLFGTRTNMFKKTKALKERAIYREQHYKGRFSTRMGGKSRHGEGVPAKHFIEKAWAEVLPTIRPTYVQIIRQTYGKLK